MIFLKMKKLIFEEFEIDVYFNEIQDAPKTLKPGKCHGLDGIINEYFIEFKDIVVPFVHTIF